MKHNVTLSWSLAVISIAFFGSSLAHARSNGMAGDDTSADVSQQATEMVPAEAALVHPLDARQVQAGHPFAATLSSGVHLKNGPELPRGTVLMGTVVTDQMQNSGQSELALRFDQAKLKNGTTVPIKATIVGLGAPILNEMGTVEPTVNSWTASTVKVDQIGVLPGVDLHSNIASPDSGVLDANGRGDLLLKRNVQISLAIAAQGNS